MNNTSFIKNAALCIIGSLSLLSCSGDDSGNASAEKIVKEVTMRIPGETSYETIKYEAGLYKERYLYFDNGADYIYEANTYNGSGRLVRIDYSRTDEPWDSAIRSLRYDSQGRIIQVTEESNNLHDIKLYDYSIPGKVVMTHEFESRISTTVFELNHDEQIYKITRVEDGDEEHPKVQEATYQGNNITKVVVTSYDEELDTNMTRTTIYTYDMETPVKGSYLKRNVSRFGAYKPNATLFSQEFVMRPDNYIKGRFTQDTTIEYTYEFDAQGCPVKIKDTRNGAVAFETTIVYQ